MRNRSNFGALALSALALLSACSSAPPPAPAAPPAPVSEGVERWLPLSDGTVFAYDTLSEPSGEKGMLVLEVKRSRTGMVELSVAGRAQRVEVDATGIRHVTGGWLLKQPPTLGAQWKGDYGSVQVTAIDRQVSVPAGNYTGCLETVESLSGADFSKRTTTVYCSGVGIVTRKTEVESDEGNGAESMKLRSFGPKFQGFQ
jgi:hypothetical protein